MFSDPFTAVMALILLAFIGTLAVFLRIWRELDQLHRAVRDIKEHMRFSAADIEQQNRDIANIARELRSLAPAGGGGERDTAGECLGELLEKGLPNLAPGNAPNAYAPDETAPDDEDTLFRRLGIDSETGKTLRK